MQYRLFTCSMLFFQFSLELRCHIGMTRILSSAPLLSWVTFRDVYLNAEIASKFASKTWNLLKPCMMRDVVFAAVKKGCEILKRWCHLSHWLVYACIVFSLAPVIFFAARARVVNVMNSTGSSSRWLLVACCLMWLTSGCAVKLMSCSDPETSAVSVLIAWFFPPLCPLA